MGKLIKAKAWCNNEVAYLAWQADGRIDGLLGFAVVRVHHDTGERRLLPAWIAFQGQSNPKWITQDTSVWPIQKFSWRDLTLRRSRDTLTVRAPLTCHYEITPVGETAPGRQSVAQWLTANPDIFSSSDPTAYTGAPVPLFVCGATFQTNAITATSSFGDFEAVFTNGILSTQNLRQQLNTPAGVTPSAADLRTHTQNPVDPLRAFLTGDVLPRIKQFVAGMAPGDHLYAALYELTDKELVAMLSGLGQRLHLILSTAGSPGKTDKVWDKENNPARVALHKTAGEMYDRLFNTTARIGHNKFLVQVGADGVAKAFLSGSTNWTDTGLCTQSNNTIVSRSADMAGAFLAYWQRLKTDTQTFPPQADSGTPNNNVQKAPLRTADAAAFPAQDLAAPAVGRLWCSPNTKAASKGTQTPGDLADVFALMDKAQTVILFLTFMPSVEGKQSVIDEAVQLGIKKPGLLVQGAVSDPEAMPNAPPAAKPGQPKAPKVPTPDIYSPPGASKVMVVRAAAVGAPYGDMEPELLKAGIAIIHDKIVVIDPFSPNCVVITGSHNLGYKASYCNDDNLLIIQGNQALAQAYSVHVLDVYEHYRQRAILEQRERERIAAGGPPVDPAAPQGGFLSTDDKWQDDYLTGVKGQESAAFL